MAPKEPLQAWSPLPSSQVDNLVLNPSQAESLKIGQRTVLDDPKDARQNYIEFLGIPCFHSMIKQTEELI
jgi:hypothetical protein